MSVTDAEFRAAGTDLSERRRSGLSRGTLIDLAASAEMTGIEWGADGAARIGALTRIAAIAADLRMAMAYPGLVAAAGGLATPQIRHLATLGGNLAQRSRCWYYRNPQIACLKKGGATCPARDGNHLYGVAFDLGPCVAPHPSTMAAALLAHDATVTTDRRRALTIAQLLGDGSDGSVDHALEPGEIIKSVALPPPMPNERALYKRAISRSYAEAARRSRPARRRRRRVFHLPARRRRRHRPRAAPAAGGRSGGDRITGNAGDDCPLRGPSHGRGQTAGHDRLQAGTAQGARSGLDGSGDGLGSKPIVEASEMRGNQTHARRQESVETRRRNFSWRGCSPKLDDRAAGRLNCHPTRRNRGNSRCATSRSPASVRPC
jgi:CO/xanthine dehydrogenase FAD-binding subunit